MSCQLAEIVLTILIVSTQCGLVEGTSACPNKVQVTHLHSSNSMDPCHMDNLFTRVQLICVKQ